MTIQSETVVDTDCCIVGGGPAGAVLGLLLARQGVRVTLLEARLDFDRDFRGDTLMPSTLELVDQLGLTERLQALLHARVREMRLHTPTGSAPYLDVSRVPSRFPYIMSIPQACFLGLIVAEAARYPHFQLVMGATVKRLLEEDGVVRGVVYTAADGVRQVRAALTIGADGRFSKVRQLGGFALRRHDEARDILWFRVRKHGDLPGAQPGLYLRPGLGYVVVVPRGAEWQIGYTLPKGRYKELQAAGLPALREAVVALVPWLAMSIADLRDWRQTSLLSIEAGRVRRWHRPGVLLIGDAAHVMSPVGGVGINCAIQDAVAAANLLGPRLRAGAVCPRDLAAVQRRREWSIRVVQLCQRAMQYRMLHGGLPELLFRFSPVRRQLMRVLALGPRRVPLAPTRLDQSVQRQQRTAA